MADTTEIEQHYGVIVQGYMAMVERQATEIASLRAQVEKMREALSDFASMPCETAGVEDLEPGCCRTCRARAAIPAPPKE